MSGKRKMARQKKGDTRCLGPENAHGKHIPMDDGDGAFVGWTGRCLHCDKAVEYDIYVKGEWVLMEDDKGGE